MTIEEIYNIEVGDKFYVTHKIQKWIFDGPWFTVYKPDKFYTVFKIDKTDTYIRLTTGSESGLNKIIVFKTSVNQPPFTYLRAKVPISIPITYMQHFNLVKKKDYNEIVNIDYFTDIYY